MRARDLLAFFRVGILCWTFLHLSREGALSRRGDKKKSVGESFRHLRDSLGGM